MKQSASPPQRLIPSAARPTRLELGLVLALFLAGGGLRCAYPERMAVEHFDEGVYASNHWFGPTDDFRYPSQHLYAPPLLPSLIDWIFTLWGPSDLAAMVPSLVAGCLTVPLMWWIGRSWFSPVAGLAAATIAAFSDPHIAFSRTALTDVMLCFWLLLAVHCIWRALNGRGLGATLGAGFFTGLAWWTKYNGWLPLAIGGAGLLAWWLANRLAGSASESTNRNIGIANVPSPPDASEAPAPPDRAAPPSEGESLWALVARMGWIAAVAFLIWLPWLWSLQSHGGYAAVASNHRGYVVGISGWWGSLETQFDNL
ncbi:MAG: ArnT family glycosyltransferase, partial [Planctomycetales bacterium]